jgi:peptidoglycan/xylan/chitin deacetylase (PgdA/CDA1 family)
VLLHDGECADEAENVAALETILTELETRGFTFAARPN